MANMKVFGGLLFALCLLVPYISAASTGFRACSKKTDYPVKISGLDIDPYPISKGKTTKYQFTASTGEAISGGKLVIDVSYFGFHVHSENHDLCDETPCPVPAGDFNVTRTQELPGYTPPGSYTLQMKMVDSSNKELACITFSFSIGFLAEENFADV
ncbi:MD-2-related lipid recognition domain-containing protein / ML domain-containing protein [Striga hermonthica]|uniref:MD-2-related lipid recognition domain-containing protein / ML domain-containing protein n=1 Tax=Striga hermonthica TaxID=68872 RepID=A0A9N7R9D1_STRHE|nr:MD-2-related lipid recognition domain-containing protein / ML domain-containing protein [Striga hermonthica]